VSGADKILFVVSPFKREAFEEFLVHHVKSPLAPLQFNIAFVPSLSQMEFFDISVVAINASNPIAFIHHHSYHWGISCGEGVTLAVNYVSPRHPEPHLLAAHEYAVGWFQTMGNLITQTGSGKRTGYSYTEIQRQWNHLARWWNRIVEAYPDHLSPVRRLGTAKPKPEVLRTLVPLRLTRRDLMPADCTDDEDNGDDDNDDDDVNLKADK